jgi:hypothetical protein
MAAHNNTLFVWLQLLLLARLSMAQLTTVCYPSGIIPDSSGSIAILQDRRLQGVMPRTLPLSVLQAEAATHHALFSSIINLQSWAVCGIQAASMSQQAHTAAHKQQQLQKQQLQPLFPAPKGWITKKVITLTGLYNGKVVDVPSAVVLQDAKSYAACKAHSKFGISSSISSTSQLLVLMRGAMLDTDYTWYAFSSSLVAAPEFGPGLLHQGAGAQQQLKVDFFCACTDLTG